MIDAVGHPSSLLLLGGTSEIGLAIAERYLSGGPVRIVLAGRQSTRLADAAARLARAGGNVETLEFDAKDAAVHTEAVRKAFAGGDIDVAVVAFGLLGDQETAWQDIDVAVELAEVNYVAAVSVGVALATEFRRQGHGRILALSSVAGERARRSNFVYGSTKAGMDAFYTGLTEALRGDGIGVTIVRPGFVHTKMTEGHGRRAAVHHPGEGRRDRRGRGDQGPRAGVGPGPAARRHDGAAPHPAPDLPPPARVGGLRRRGDPAGRRPRPGARGTLRMLGRPRGCVACP